MHTNISLQQAKVRFSQMQTTPAALLENVEELVLLVLFIASSLLTSSCMCQHMSTLYRIFFTELTHRVGRWGLKLNTENQVSSIQLCQSLIAACLQDSADRILWAQRQVFPSTYCEMFRQQRRMKKRKTYIASINSAFFYLIYRFMVRN